MKCNDTGSLSELIPPPEAATAEPAEASGAEAIPATATA